MANTSLRSSPSSKRGSSTSSQSTPPSLTRGSTARSAASPRLSALYSSTSRRPATSPIHAGNGEVNEVLAASLKQETDQKEHLLIQMQEKDQMISKYIMENDDLNSALSSAETRLNDLYAEQSRWELEMAQRIDISEKLREQVRELEKEKRDLQRRYNEQMTTFDAERQAFYDNEQHLKSRIQSLTQARKPLPSAAPEPETEFEQTEEEPHQSSKHPPVSNKIGRILDDSGDEPAEMTSLKLELSTLSTSYSSLQSTLILMQTQLVDLKRVNQELQEENESYMILLREKTLSGQFDLIKQVGGISSSDGEDSSATEENEGTDASSMRSLGQTILERVEEESEAILPEDHEDPSVPDLRHSARASRHRNRPERKRSPSTYVGRGESLADLPITGPGLDLAAELGRAENKDILAGGVIEDRERFAPPVKSRRSKKSQDGSKGPQSEISGMESSTTNADIDALRTEVKSLKDANKALSLYASKIIDRIIAQEGFEHVLAADYEKNSEPSTPSTAVPRSNMGKSLPFSRSNSRPQSVNLGGPLETTVKPISTISATADPKAKRRSLSFDWTSFSLFNAERKTESSPNLRPLTLKPGAAHVTGARKLETVEDEEDRKERERLHATMKLMGIQPPVQIASRLSNPLPTDRSYNTTDPNAKSNRRFSLFGSKSLTEKSDTPSGVPMSDPGQFDQPSFGLTEEALEHAEAQNSLAALDARERDLSAEIGKGAGGGFTEIARRSSRRGRRSAGGSSGSTVWSAGMSGNGDD